MGYLHCKCCPAFVSLLQLHACTDHNVTLNEIQLTGELGVNPVILSESLKEFKMSAS